jgi:hypothetical protein
MKDEVKGLGQSSTLAAMRAHCQGLCMPSLGQVTKGPRGIIDSYTWCAYSLADLKWEPQKN